ncbi:hypothetical protein AB6F55_10090 [Providencia hangzhouensis]
MRLSYKQAGSFNSGVKLAARVTIIFNLIGIGLDIYQAYEAFEQLDKITDAKSDNLLVNGSLSIANIVVGSLTIIGIIIGSSTIPVVGLIVGGELWRGQNVLYTGIRAVENRRGIRKLFRLG